MLIHQINVSAMTRVSSIRMSTKGCWVAEGQFKECNDLLSAMRCVNAEVHLKKSQVDKLAEQLSSAIGLQVASQATQLLQKLHQVAPSFRL